MSLHTIRVHNVTRQTILAEHAAVADTSSKRRTGLLKHDVLPAGEGLWIVPCEGVHTFWMKFAIDIVYLSRKRKVVKVARRVAPWRVSICLRAHSVLELPAGTIDATKTARGDMLEFTPVSGT